MKTKKRRQKTESELCDIQYVELFNNMRSGVSVYEVKNNGKSFIIADFNKAAEIIEGKKANDVIGKNVLYVFPGARRSGIYDSFKRVWITGKPEHHPIYMYKEGKKVFWRENYIYKLPSGNIVEIYDDITDKKLAEEEKEKILINLNERIKELSCLYRINNIARQNITIPEFLDTVVSIMPIAWRYPEITGCSIDFEGHKYKTCNFRKTKFVKEADIIVNDEKKGLIKVCYLKCFNNKCNKSSLFNNEEKSLIDSIAKQIGLFIERNKSREEFILTNEKLKQSNEELKELDKAKSDFLNIVSHELKTPLTAVFAHMGVIDDFSQDFNQVQNSSFEAIKRNVKNLKSLINNILEISRIEAGKFELNLSRLSIEQEIKHVVNDLKVLNKKNLDFEFKIDKLPNIVADQTRVREILINLIGNAIKFTPQGKITIKSIKFNNYIKTSIIDTGIGVPYKKKKQLFQKFYQVDSSLNRKYDGTGLGLSITKHLVELQGGKIGFNSKLKKGSEFHFTLPINRGG